MKFEIAQSDKDRHFEFWHALNGLAAICDFGDITTTLVLDMFILHMKTKKCRSSALSQKNLIRHLNLLLHSRKESKDKKLTEFKFRLIQQKCLSRENPYLQWRSQIPGNASGAGKAILPWNMSISAWPPTTAVNSAN